jgi:site-specific recombinase XerD
MLTKSFTMFYYLKKRNNYVKGNLPIYLRLTIDGKRVELATKRECEPEKWNSSAGRKSGNKEEVKLLNAYLDTLQGKIYEIHRQLISDGKEITAEVIKDKLTGVADKPKMILEVFQRHNEKLRQLAGNEYAFGTVVRYETSLEHTKNFIFWKFKQHDFDINRLNYEFISEYEFWLKTVRKCGHNTAMKYLANFKKIVLIYVKSGWLAKDPFFAFKLGKREVDREALNSNEVIAITKKVFVSPRLDQVRDIFLFCCYTGLSYVDVHKLKRSEVIDGIDGEKWLVIKRQKTDSPSRIPILPFAWKILEKYKDHAQCKVKGQLLPVLSNQRMNSYLKEIADICGVEKTMTFHLARHTFATTITLTNGVPIESVSKMLGHRSIKTTQQYAKIVDKKISDDMINLRKLLESKSKK